MTTQKFDELNLFKISTKWFEGVNVSAEERKKRVKLSLDYCEIMIMLFLMIVEENYEREDCIAFAEERLKVLAERELGREDIAYINEWAKIKAEAIVAETYLKYENEIEDATLESEEKVLKFEEEGVEIPENEYWTSDFRALKIGIELSQTVRNFKELSDAIDEGKTRKTWITKEDTQVRDTHEAMAGVEIPINEFFIVGNSQMLMPGDTANGAEMKEIAGCRCHIECH